MLNRETMDSPGTYVPPHMRDGLEFYIERGIEPGGFMAAVLCNDLRESFGRADTVNKHYIGNIVAWLYNYAPSDCWGSPENYNAYLTKMQGKQHA